MKLCDCKPGTAVRTLSGDYEGIVIGNIFTTGIIIAGVRMPAVDIMTTKGNLVTWPIVWLEKLRN